jgi:RNA polymerase sigma-70 factor (ECF subfamily)
MSAPTSSLNSAKMDAGRPTFEAVYAAEFRFVWRLVAFRGVPASLRDDVVHEVFLVVHRKLSEFEGRSSLRGWLAGIVRKVVKDQLALRRHRAAGEEMAAEPADPRLSPEAQLEQRRILALVDEILAEMPPEQRDVFVLHEVEGLSGREIAEALSENPNTIWTRLRAARRRFDAAVDARPEVLSWTTT